MFIAVVRGSFLRRVRGDHGVGLHVRPVRVLPPVMQIAGDEKADHGNRQ
jgi:hypothetical protein